MKLIKTKLKVNNHQKTILTEAERHQLLVEWNDTTIEYPKDKCIHQLFEAQVEKTPDAIAVKFEGKKLTYQQLNQRSNKLAHYLKTLGVGVNVKVGICVERSLEMVIGLLGILKAGGAYVPIDASYPAERLNYMLGDTAVPILLTSESILEHLPEHSARMVFLDRDWRAITRLSDKNLNGGVKPENLGYVIYTSGSTGKPKGVAMSQRSLVNLITWQQQETIISKGTTLQFAPISFDVSFQEIFSTLCSGGILVLVSQEVRRDSFALMQFLIENRVDKLFLPFVALQQLAAVATKCQTLPELSEIVTAGEQLQITTEIIELMNRLPNCRLQNQYGPSETHVVSAYTFQGTATNWPTLPPIGRPIANNKVYILNHDLQPVPIGIAGELYIGGTGVAKGYLNRPELTAQKFISNPFIERGESLLYKTGDLARYLPDGNIEYLGRIDNQVKIRGFRIELGEIEAFLNTHSQIQQAVVIAREDIPGNKRLIAYFIPAQEQFSTHNLRRFLQDKLPDYAIPSNFVKLEFLPLTPNGKIDRKALPEPDKIRPELENNFVAPRNQTEELLANIWSELLEVEKVGIQDNFFELGGDSLLATKLIFQIRETFQIKIYVKTLFYSPTIVKLAPTIEEILQTGVYDKEKIDFNAEAILDLTIIPQTTVNQNIVEPQNILLTGVTGFVGAYLLDELLRKTSANIYCLIRANNTDLAKQKLKNKLEDYLLWDEKLSSRIIPVVGDLCSRFFGLPTEKFNFLAHEIDVIYHSGAWVNHIYPYTVLKSANVLGTQEILRLASETSVKPVHFISSLGVLPSSSNSESTTILESAPLTETPNLKSGYIQSKWVAEKLVMAASDRGIPTCIYRLPMITADTNTGVSNINDRICRQIKGCLQLGMVPILESKLVDNWVPVNDMSQAIVYLSRKENSLGKTFHLMNSTSTSLNHLFDWICSLDSSVKKVSSNDWVSELSNHPENVLYPYILKLEFQIEKSTEKQAEIPSQIIDTQNTNNGLKGSQIIQFTPIDEKYFETMLSYLTNSSKS
ncbi:MAG: amino acid adenylation domain-containing protein [Okeania sp. SIO2G4]|uniref:non-ribosomal peptide synthetase family protein n=1 Tax=unclassified Okeania TaxID=2634635 RepID=UPI0013BC8EF4|nr:MULTISPECIES: non-ribosomal peptide synthetase [unclassified Okeania]NEP72942.1 amino acid adenylation domain-containing protein [Okeania sp. SIO2G5]NEP93753.1 amino acid adenylation domain-containing protein [Okeania sp. SIO2F5]NEQ93866.1 amino acid adenylation domain-containing protein [Okeania sp. SIO2G4]